MAFRPLVSPDYNPLGRSTPYCSRSSRIFGWSSGHGEYGGRFMVSSSFFQFFGTSDHVQWHFSYGRGSPSIIDLYPWAHFNTDSNVFHQCLCHFFSLSTWYVKVFHQKSEKGKRVEKAPSCPFDWVDPLRYHSYDHGH